MTVTKKLLATAFLGFSVVLTATACGSENDATSSADSSATVVTPPANSSIPVVGGPKPKTTSADAAPSSRSAEGDQTCGATKGPDGALQIHIVEGDVSCDTAKTIAKEYGPLIATGAPQTVSGWDCGPSKVVGELARCTKGSQAFALMPN
ncbi:hypothetical protein [Gordonia sp. (in: high G+C Gram-positive bacteria)]|uniref:hypothetical protein n=1 Tax=Gordonia sp. (in: high G+C Gram-positive bacteria) TaxID=84139 RepID=UPI003C7181E2